VASPATAPRTMRGSCGCAAMTAFQRSAGCGGTHETSTCPVPSCKTCTSVLRRSLERAEMRKRAHPDDPSADSEAEVLARAVADLDDELAGLG
jgi:hypothetical protein